MYYCNILLEETVLLSYIPNILCVALKIATKALTYCVQRYKKLHSNGVMHCTIVLLVLKGRALYKGPWS